MPIVRLLGMLYGYPIRLIYGLLNCIVECVWLSLFAYTVYRTLPSVVFVWLSVKLYRLLSVYGYVELSTDTVC